MNDTFPSPEKIPAELPAPEQEPQHEATTPESIEPQSEVLKPADTVEEEKALEAVNRVDVPSGITPTPEVPAHQPTVTPEALLSLAEDAENEGDLASLANAVEQAGFSTDDERAQ